MTQELLETLAEDLAARPDFVLATNDATSAPILVVGRDGRIRYANKAVALLSGYPRQRLIGQTIELLVPDDVREQHRAFREAFFLRPSERTMARELAELRLRNCDGVLLSVKIVLRPIELVGGVFVVATIHLPPAQ